LARQVVQGDKELPLGSLLTIPVNAFWRPKAARNSGGRVTLIAGRPSGAERY